MSERLEMRWLPVVDASGRTRMEASWIPVAAGNAAENRRSRRPPETARAHAPASRRPGPH